MIQVNTENMKRKQTSTFLKPLSGSVQNALALAVLFFALAVEQGVQAQSTEGTFHISVGEKLKDLHLTQLCVLNNN
jgi:hypothetical protein